MTDQPEQDEPDVMLRVHELSLRVSLPDDGTVDDADKVGSLVDRMNLLRGHRVRLVDVDLDDAPLFEGHVSGWDFNGASMDGVSIRPTGQIQMAPGESNNELRRRTEEQQ